MKAIRAPKGIPEARLIGCCGAYCKTCRAFVLGSCRGCKLGYERGERYIARARCRIKRCCFGDRDFETCAECPELGKCETLASFYGKKWKEYGRYRESLEFIRREGYSAFIGRSRGWDRAYGELRSRSQRKGHAPKA